MKALQTITNATGRLGLQIEKHSPELLLGAGIISFVGTVVLACKATTKMSQIMEKHNEELELLKTPEVIEPFTARKTAAIIPHGAHIANEANADHNEIITAHAEA